MSSYQQQFQLPDGRRLGYDEYGSTDGMPLFYFHGSPSSRIEFTLFGNEELLKRSNVRLVAMDRPGMGLSDFQPNRNILDWSHDVLALADHLGIKRFAILAYSLGGPYGLACAYSIPQRLTKVGIMSGAALFTVPELWKDINEGTRRFLSISKENPLMSRLFLWAFSAMTRLAPNRFIAQANSLLPAVDREIILSDPKFQQGFIRMVREATRQGTRGAHHESLLTITDWGFRIEDIRMPLHVWHGDEDKNIPVEMARHLQSVVPECDAKFFPAEGHLSLFKKNIEQIILALSI